MYKDKDKQGDADRIRQQRRRDARRDEAKGVTQGVTEVGADGQYLNKESPTAVLELCRYCGEPLPALQHPRKWPGACLPCALKQPAKPSGDYKPYFTGQMTDFEREHYKPADQLAKGEHNPVSKPGQDARQAVQQAAGLEIMD